MSDLPSHNVEIGLDPWDTTSFFELSHLISSNSGDDEDAEFPSQAKYFNEIISKDYPYENYDVTDGIINYDDPCLSESSTEEELNSTTTDFIGTDINNSQNEFVIKANNTTDFVDAPSTFLSTDVEPITEQSCFIQIKKSPSKRTEGHYKADGDVIVTRYFLADKGKRIKFQTKEVINHGETVTISMTVQMIGKKLAPKPRLLLGKEISKESRCICFSLHEESPFCILSEQATVDWFRIDDRFKVVLKPVTANILEIDIGIWSTHFGKGYAAQLDFQLQRDGKTLRQEYFVKTCALLGRDLIPFSREINDNFPDRFKWFEKGLVFEDYEPSRKKIRLSEEEESFQTTLLHVQCPSDNTSELLNLLKDDSQYQYLRL